MKSRKPNNSGAAQPIQGWGWRRWAFIVGVAVLVTGLVLGSWWLTEVDESVNGNTWVGLVGSVLGGAVGGLVAVLIYRHTVKVERVRENLRREEERDQQAVAWQREREARREAMRSDVGRKAAEIVQPIWAVEHSHEVQVSPRKAAESLGSLASFLHEAWEPGSNQDVPSLNALQQLCIYFLMWSEDEQGNPPGHLQGISWDQVGRAALEWVAALTAGEGQRIDETSHQLYGTVVAARAMSTQPPRDG